MITKSIEDCFYVTPSKDRLSAEINSTDLYEEGLDITEAAIIKYLNEQKIIYGINQEIVSLLASGSSSIEFPLIIAEGITALNGEDGKVIYEPNFNTEITRTANWNFREVMRIPSVNTDEKLATIVLPTLGTAGKTIFGGKLKPRQGKPAQLRAGQNVRFDEVDNSFYATSSGQISVGHKQLKVHDVYELNESLSMKVGNLDFIGSIIIHGDVPTGFTVKAGGDVKIFGIVEAATITAGGSISISEGLAGLQKGVITAGEDIQIGYINQGIVSAGNTVYVENSILHSECIAENSLYCQRGNIIGGSISAGTTIEAKDIGNRLSTETKINLGVNRQVDDEETELLAEKATLETTLKQLRTIGKKLEAQGNMKDAKMRVTMLRQRSSQAKVIEQIKVIEKRLSLLNPVLGSEKDAELIVRDNIYPNTVVAFGKYKRTINKVRHKVKMKLNDNEVSLLGE